MDDAASGAARRFRGRYRPCVFGQGISGCAAAHCGLDWQKYVEIDPRYFRPTEVDYLLGDSTKVRKALGWKPKVEFPELVRIMMDHDMDLAKQERTLANAGHKIALHG